MSDSFKKYLAEFLGTFALVFVGVGSVIVSGLSPDVGGGMGLVGIAAAHGLILSVMISALGHHSGGHFNPAVTIGFLITGRIGTKLAAGYVASQLVGAVAGAGILSLAIPSAAFEAVNCGAASLGSNVSIGGGIAIEAVMTFLLVLVVFATAVDERGTFRSIAGFGIGLTVFAGILAAGPLTGAALNPARAFGPAFIGGHWNNHIVWWVGPAIGGAAAALLYHSVYFRGDQASRP